jgi:hypothetical protein
VTLTVQHHRGALQADERPTTRTVQVDGLAPDVAGDLAAALLDLSPHVTRPGPGPYRVAVAGGAVVVTIAPLAPPTPRP